MLVVFGSVAFDTIRTLHKAVTPQCEMGGAATYAGISASLHKDRTVGSNRKTFSKKIFKCLVSKHMNLRGLSIKDGKTFRYLMASTINRIAH